MTQDANNVYFVLADGTRITIPKAASVENIVLTYIPRYSDGKATVFYVTKADSYVEFDFEVSPASAAADWQNYATVKAVYTETRAGVEFVDMDILSWTTDTAKGTITVKASGKNLSDEFFAGAQEASARLVVNGSDTNLISEYVPMVAKKIIIQPTNEIWYTSTDGNIVEPYDTSVFGANIVSNTYENDKGLITFDGNVTIIGFTAFKGCSSLINITLPNYVTKIDRAAFKECTNLTSINIPDEVVLIGDEAFEECRNLKSIIIPNGVTSLDYEVFRNCSSLESIVIPESVTAIKWLALSLCSSLTNVTISNSVTSIESQAFTGCSSLQSITIPDEVTDIGSMTFSNCSSLLNVIIGESVESIGNYAFYNCSSLTSVEIGDSVTSIGNTAFWNCNSLTTITIPDSVTEIGDGAFYGCI